MYQYHHPRPAVTVDLVLLGRDSDEEYRLLLVQRKGEPYAGLWAFPGGFVNVDEKIKAAAYRELREETGYACEADLQFAAILDDVERDPRGRVISFAFYAVLPDTPLVVGADDAADASWFKLDELPLPLAFDHNKLLGIVGGLLDG